MYFILILCLWSIPINMTHSQADQQGWHTIEVEGRHYTLPNRYQNAFFAGQGTFGAVM